MGILDKVKRLAGDHGVTAAITRIEDQDPEGAVFALKDPIIKFDVEVRTDKPATITAHRFDVFVEQRSGDEPRLACASFTVHDSKSEVVGQDRPSWPYTLMPGTVVGDDVVMRDIDLPRTLKELGVIEARSVLADPTFRFFVKFTASVEGSIVGATDEVELKVSEK